MSAIRNGTARAAVGDNRAPIMPSTVEASTMTTITPIARSMARSLLLLNYRGQGRARSAKGAPGLL
jgi:hypothetical protein